MFFCPKTLFRPFLLGQNFSILLWSRLMGLTHPPYGRPDRKISEFFLTTLLSIMESKNSSILMCKSQAHRKGPCELWWQAESSNGSRLSSRKHRGSYVFSSSVQPTVLLPMSSSFSCSLTRLYNSEKNISSQNHRDLSSSQIRTYYFGSGRKDNDIFKTEPKKINNI